MTTEPTKLPVSKPSTPKTRKASAKTLYRLLAQYIRENDIPKAESVESVVERLKSSIVAEEVGPSLDVFK